MTDAPDILTVKEAAELLRCSEETIRVNARNGVIPALKKALLDVGGHGAMIRR